MKRWFLTLILGPSLKKLRKPLDPVFVANLRTTLKKKAHSFLEEDRISFIPYEWNNMKKYSYIYGTSLVAVAVLAYIFFPSSSLSAEEVIQKASAAYSEAQSGHIYHEKRLSERFEGNTLKESSLEEFWINLRTDESLFTTRNPENNELYKASGVSSQGDSYNYPSDNQDFDENQKDWFKTFAGDKYICRTSTSSNNLMAESSLKISAKDSSVYTLDGSAYNPNELPENYFDTVISSSSLGKIKTILKNFSLGTDTEPNYKLVEEQGKNYYVFTISLEDKRSEEEYFDATNFQLEKLKVYETNPSDYTQTTYLLTEYLDETEAEKIFDFTSYGMALSYGVSAGNPSYITEDGCYTPSGELMNEEAKNTLLSTIPSEVVKQWEDQPKEIIQDTTNEESEEPISFQNGEGEAMDSTTENTEVNSAGKNQFLIRPTEGMVSQGFHANHPGIDFADDGKTPPVVAAAAGTVSAVGINWNGGYGNAVTINIGNGYSIFYAHLTKFNVKVGDTVAQGQVIGTMGNTGRVYGNPGTHLHFELSYKGEKIDPSSYIKNL